MQTISIINNHADADNHRNRYRNMGNLLLYLLSVIAHTITNTNTNTRFWSKN